ncbi:MAG: hypothetical protein NTU61_02470, partial [Candidatus Altiarchaeota archaeon]|nr:hypothetical protein [Candidatus Altiarchaeota archaeon]
QWFGTALGYKCKSNGWGAIAAVAESEAYGIGSVALGYLSNTSANYAVALGHNIVNSQPYSLAVGFGGDPSLRVTNTTVSINYLLKLTPTDIPRTCDASNEGLIYADDSMNVTCYCNGGGWVSMADFTTSCVPT